MNGHREEQEVMTARLRCFLAKNTFPKVPSGNKQSTASCLRRLRVLHFSQWQKAPTRFGVDAGVMFSCFRAVTCIFLSSRKAQLDSDDISCHGAFDPPT